MGLLIEYTLIYAVVLTLTALGGMISERAGVINLGLEGIMVIGALAGALVMRAVGTAVWWLLPATLAAAALAGVIYSLLLVFASVYLHADQLLVGTAMNMLSVAFASVLVKSLNVAADPGDVSSIVAYNEGRNSLFFSVGGMSLSWFLPLAAVILAVMWLVLNKTPFGLRLMACGEHPFAAASVGISVTKMQVTGVLLSGALGGLGGIAYITAAVYEWDFVYGVSGFGFLALAVMIFGKWRPLPIAAAALLFGVLRALSNVYTGFAFLEKLGLPSALYNAMPYIICLVVLAVFSSRGNAPGAEGIPYIKGQEE